MTKVSIKENYPDVKTDLSMIMYKRAIDGFSVQNGFVSFITTSSWMTLSSFEKLRLYQSRRLSFVSLVDFGTELFEGKVGHNPIVSWVVRNKSLDYRMTSIRLVDYCYSRRDEKEPMFFDKRNRYYSLQKEFDRIDGAPVAYWMSPQVLEAFKGTKIGDVAVAKVGIGSGNTTMVP